MVVLKEPPLGCLPVVGVPFFDFDFDRLISAELSGGKMIEMLRLWLSMLPPTGVRGDGRPRSKESSGWPPS